MKLKSGLLLLGLLVASAAARRGFDIALGKCIVLVLYGTADRPPVSDSDMFEERLWKIRKLRPEELSFSDFADPTIIRDINNAFLHFGSLPDVIRKEIKECGLQKVEAKAAALCQDTYGGCNTRGEERELVHFQKCPNSFPEIYLDGFCFPKCPVSESASAGKPRRDLYRCPKERAILLKPYSSRDICESFSQVGKCVELPQTLWVSRCPPTHSQVFNFLCIPICSPTWIGDRKFCQKRTYKILRTPFVPNFSDMIYELDEPHTN